MTYNVFGGMLSLTQSINQCRRLTERDVVIEAVAEMTTVEKCKAPVGLGLSN